MARWRKTDEPAAQAEIIAAIEQLTPAQRRALQRRLHAQGLFVAEDLLSDQNRLKVAPAVRDPGLPGAAQARRPSLFDVQTESSPAQTPAAPPPVEPPPVEPPARGRGDKSSPEPQVDLRPIADPSAEILRSVAAPAAGRVVIGAPRPPAATPSAMAPLPGQAPEGAITIVFDGGSKGNPGDGYGRYQMVWPGAQPLLVRLQFGRNYTNNQAEYDTLIGALEDLLRRLEQQGAAPATARVEISGDSKLVISQVLGEWKCKDAGLIPRRDRVRELLRPLGRWSLQWHGREHSVRTLGH